MKKNSIVMNSEFGRMHLPGQTEENREIPQSK
jgi:hypothetical protein